MGWVIVSTLLLCGLTINPLFLIPALIIGIFQFSNDVGRAEEDNQIVLEELEEEYKPEAADNPYAVAGVVAIITIAGAAAVILYFANLLQQNGVQVLPK